MKEHEDNKPRMGEEILRGLEEMRDALRDGQKLQHRFTMRTVELELQPREFTADQVQHLRNTFHASQSVFAMMIGVSPRTLQDWEQGRKSPPPWAGRLLQLMQDDPKPWRHMLENATRAKTLA